MKHDSDINATPDNSEHYKESGEIKALIRNYYIDYGVDISDVPLLKNKITPELNLTILATIVAPKLFKDENIAVVIIGHEGPFTEIIGRSLGALPKRLQHHLYQPDYKYLGIIHWIAGQARENPPADYNTLYSFVHVDMDRFLNFCNLLIKTDSNTEVNQFVILRATGLESEEFASHKQLSVAIKGMKLSIETSHAVRVT